jgi:hypothetical protein
VRCSFIEVESPALWMLVELANEGGDKIRREDKRKEE